MQLGVRNSNYGPGVRSSLESGQAYLDQGLSWRLRLSVHGDRETFGLVGCERGSKFQAKAEVQLQQGLSLNSAGGTAISTLWHLSLSLRLGTQPGVMGHPRVKT